MPAVTQTRYLIPCACCGHEILAERVGDTIVVRSKRHGRMHVAVIHMEHLTMQPIAPTVIPSGRVRQ